MYMSGKMLTKLVIEENFLNPIKAYIEILQLTLYLMMKD